MTKVWDARGDAAVHKEFCEKNQSKNKQKILNDDDLLKLWYWACTVPNCKKTLNMRWVSR